MVGLGLLPPSLSFVAVAVGRGRVAPGAVVLVAGRVAVIPSVGVVVTVGVGVGVVSAGVGDVEISLGVGVVMPSSHKPGPVRPLL